MRNITLYLINCECAREIRQCPRKAECLGCNVSLRSPGDSRQWNRSQGAKEGQSFGSTY